MVVEEEMGSLEAAAREGCGRRMGRRLVLNPQINNVLGFGDNCSSLLGAGGLWPVLALTSEKRSRSG